MDQLHCRVGLPAGKCPLTLLRLPTVTAEEPVTPSFRCSPCLHHLTKGKLTASIGPFKDGGTSALLFSAVFSLEFVLAWWKKRIQRCLVKLRQILWLLKGWGVKSIAFRVFPFCSSCPTETFWSLPRCQETGGRRAQGVPRLSGTLSKPRFYTVTVWFEGLDVCFCQSLEMIEPRGRLKVN